MDEKDTSVEDRQESAAGRPDDPSHDPSHDPSLDPSLVPELAPGMVACVFCGNLRFRRSRVRSADLRELLLLRLPVRCTRCGQRQYTSFGVAGIALPPKSHGTKLAQGPETWRAWTEPGKRRKTIRPMSTAAEPKARNIEKPREPMRRIGEDDGPVW